MRVHTAVVPAAGMGTRFLPATKAVPKELLPIIDTPALQLIIDEAVGAGVDHMVIVTSRAKPAIEAYFQPQPEVIAKLRSSGRDQLADRVEALGRDVKVSFAYQDQALGLGHAVGCAREVVGDEPFAVLLPDELMGSSSLLDQMAQQRITDLLRYTRTYILGKPRVTSVLLSREARRQLGLTEAELARPFTAGAGK